MPKYKYYLASQLLIILMTTTTYTSLQTDSLLNITLDFSVLKQNFTSINQFIKSFSQFQKKFTQLQKSQKTLNDNFSSFKLSTQSQFSTINQVLQSRNQISQGKSSAANEELNDIRKSIKQLKTFMTQSTRQEHEAQQIRQEEQNGMNNKLQQEIKELRKENGEQSAQIQLLSKGFNELEIISAKKSQISQLYFKLQNQLQSLTKCNEKVSSLDKLLRQTKVQQFKSLIDEIDHRTTNEIIDMKNKFNTKANISDLLKLQEMMLNVTQFGFQNVSKVMANKVETKKALTFLEKRLNSLLVMVLGEDENEREALITAKQIKCISCSKDLGDVEGKLDKNKNWSIFPAKEPNLKEKYAGFGAGFQSIVESTVAKKGGQLKYDQKGRMIQPFNLTGTIQGSLLKPSRSHQKMNSIDSKSKLNISPNKNSLKYETSFMNQFGKEGVNGDINITEEYYNRFKGLQSYVISAGKTYQRETPSNRKE